jgi:hypothetical protein
MFRKIQRWCMAAFLASCCFGMVQAQAPAYYTGHITSIEVWKTGNVAFSMYVHGTAGIPCNGQLILNKSDPGFKNQYAAVVAAKLADKPVRVYVGTCVAAEGYGASYAEVSYLYID